MDFLTTDDFKAVCDDSTLEVISQADNENLARAEAYAMEEISGYLRPRYDMARAFDGGDPLARNPQLVMIAVDITLYHLIAWLPRRMGFEIRELRYRRAIEWCESVQAGKASPALPPITDGHGNDIGGTVAFGSMRKSRYDY